ncbi:alpha/beta fold hydrolase [Streptomyces sp. NPDC056663]|uniref:alpha/beta fold hydrolase n=1 Tax=Streptomyces sp. NPDC056663 TaxID=3345899 RepID=UPI0036C4C861
MVAGEYRVEVGGHRISAVVRGSGGPAVVIEPGWGSTVESWEALAQALSTDTTVVTYDRPGYRTSDRARDRRTPDDVARDLQGVLGAVGVDGPLVLVGHSAGGLYARAFAARYGERVVGLVLVDTAYEGQWCMLARHLPLRARLEQRVLTPVGIALSRRKPGGIDPRTLLRELRGWMRLAPSARLEPGVLGSRPLALLTRTPGDLLTNELDGDGTAASAAWRCWHGFHQELARLSGDSRHVVAERSGHNMHLDDPSLVVSTIRDVLRSVRTGSRLEADRPGQ